MTLQLSNLGGWVGIGVPKKCIKYSKQAHYLTHAYMGLIAIALVTERLLGLDGCHTTRYELREWHSGELKVGN